MSFISRGLPAQQPQPPAQQAPASSAPQVEIVSLAPARGFVVGQDTVTIIGKVRNAGKTPLPANTVTVRIYALAGLDYTEGDLAPKLPALEPGATVTFKWRLQATSQDALLVAALAIEVPGALPLTRTLAIQHFSDFQIKNGATIPKEAVAHFADDEGVIENSKVRARIVFSNASVPVLLLSSRTAGGIRQVAVSLPLAEVLSSEGGQQPWWEVFRGDEFRAANRKGEATLTLSGGFGLRWRATFEFTLRTDSSVLDTRMQISPLRSVKLSGLRFFPLLVGEGSFGAASSERITAESAGSATRAAIRWGAVTVGGLWFSGSLFPGWTSSPVPEVEGADYQLLGVETRTPDAPVALNNGATVVVRGRIFALTPSQTVAEAKHIFLPVK